MAPQQYLNLGIHPNREEFYYTQHNPEAAGILSQQIPYPLKKTFTTTHHEDLTSFLLLIL
jgi:hypothetical protein